VLFEDGTFAVSLEQLTKTEIQETTAQKIKIFFIFLLFNVCTKLLPQQRHKNIKSPNDHTNRPTTQNTEEEILMLTY